MWEIKGTTIYHGYVMARVPNHPKAMKGGYVYMHRVVMENHLGRLLQKDEVVHHKDKNKTNNDLSNLVLLTNAEHVKLHMAERLTAFVELRCPWCKTIFIKEKRNTHLVKPSVHNCTCCSATCRGKLYSYIQYHKLTKKVKKAIENNVIRVFNK